MLCAYIIDIHRIFYMKINFKKIERIFRKTIMGIWKKIVWLLRNHVEIFQINKYALLHPFLGKTLKKRFFCDAVLKNVIKHNIKILHFFLISIFCTLRKSHVIIIFEYIMSAPRRLMNIKTKRPYHCSNI